MPSVQTHLSIASHCRRVRILHGAFVMEAEFNCAMCLNNYFLSWLAFTFTTNVNDDETVLHGVCQECADRGME